MRIHFRGATSVVLMILFLGCVVGISAQVQTTSKALEPTLPLPTADGATSTNVTSGSPKAAAQPADPAAGDPNLPPDAKTTPAPKSKVKDAKDAYVVGIADGLYISVWKEQDLSGLVVVRPDGMITVPVVGDIHVAGLTTPQVQDLLTEKLKDVVAEPQVTVIVRDIRSRKAYLVGKVGRPGAIELTSPETVLQILAEAGGPAQLAKPQKMYVLRTTDGKQKHINFNYKKVLAGSEPDLQVMVGDIIVVP